MVCILLVGVYLLPTTVAEEPNIGELMNYNAQFVHASTVPTIGTRTTPICNCVALAKKITGFKESIGLAKYWPVNRLSPEIGAVVITNESNMGHVGIVRDIQDGKIKIYENNYVSCTTTTDRWLDMNSPLILGYWIK